MTEVYITDDDRIKISHWDMEEVPKEERPYPNSDGIRGLMGSLRRTNKKIEYLDYNGSVSFGNGEYNFQAWFKNGRMVDIIKK